MSLDELRDAWRGQWPQALALWSKYTRLSEPRWCLSVEDEKREGLSGSFAMIRLHDQGVVISLRCVARDGLEAFPLEVMGHEIGHHVYCPGDLTDDGRMLARMRRALPTKERLAGFIGNLYGDLLINDRLQRSGRVNIAAVFQKLGGGSKDRMWTFYMRIYEILWSLQRGTLAKGPVEASMEGDAHLGARLIRSYAGDWLRGSGRFASLCLRYLIEDDGAEMRRVLQGWLDAEQPGSGGTVPPGLSEIDPDELEGALHPSLDPWLADLEDDAEPASTGPRPAGQPAASGSRGQYREPFEYGQILRALGLDLTDHEIAVRYYRERAVPHLVRFPTRRRPETQEPLPEGLESWDVGSPLEAVDWLESVLVSPRVVPGMTTMQRTWGTMDGALPQIDPVDLDLYVDCSGSMPNPQRATSFLTLAGTIIALSALRVGARVQATLWSGAGQFQTTGGFVSDEGAVLRILTGFLGGATAFPIHLLRDTYANRRDRKVHILVISDDGVDTMFARDERGGDGWEISQAALASAGGGGTLVLNLPQDWTRYPFLGRAAASGWNVFRITTWDELVEFAARFSRAAYEVT